MQRNVMTWATILLAVSGVLAAVIDVLPQAEALGLAKAAIIAGAAGRALVFAAKEIAGIYHTESVEVGGGDDESE